MRVVKVEEVGEAGLGEIQRLGMVLYGDMEVGEVGLG